jgi:hypothetical protein
MHCLSRLAKSEKGTEVKIPINSESVSESTSFIFLWKEKYNIKVRIVEDTQSYKGLELNSILI